MPNYVAIEKMKYKKDTLSYSLALLGLFVNILYFFSLYHNNGNEYYSYKMGLSVLYNLIFMLAVFLSAEKVKAYYRSFGIALVIIGCIQIVRIFIYPQYVFELGALPKNTYIKIIYYLIISGVFLISSGIISIIKSTILKKFIEGKLTFKNKEQA